MPDCQPCCLPQNNPSAPLFPALALPVLPPGFRSILKHDAQSQTEKAKCCFCVCKQNAAKFISNRDISMKIEAGRRAEKGHNKSLSNTRQAAFPLHDKLTDVTRTQHGHDGHPSALHFARQAADLLTFKVAGGAATPPAGTQPVSVVKG